MHVDCDLLFQVCLILAVGCVAGCLIPKAHPGANTALGWAGVVLCFIGLIVALVC